MKRSAFSLIELMIAVSVLAIGIVLIARSFLSASNALSISENKIAAISLLAGKMSQLEEDALNTDSKFKNVKEDMTINGRKVVFNSDFEEIDIGNDEKSIFLNKITLSAGWREGNRFSDEILATYIRNEKKEEA